MKSYTNEIRFEGDGTDFSGLRDAQGWRDENGLESGSMQRDAPIGVCRR